LLDFVLGESDVEASATPDADSSLTHLGPYTIEETLGRGGMGVVYRARHGGLERVVALKVLDPACARQAEFPLRFQREGQMLAALDHPHIVGVHDLGCEAGVYYLAMELVPGQTLRQRLGSGPLPWSEAVAIFGQLCDALQYAHDRGIVHRDIKPENILLSSGTPALVKLGDFGIAKMVDSDPQSSLTQANAVIGTRAYMAPEQLEHARPVDHRTDIYALGVVFYEMLTCELPLGVFAPPSHKATVDPRVDGVLLRALEKDPERRYRSAAEFKQAVLTIGAGAAPARRRPGPLRRAVILLLLAVPLVYGAWLVRPSGAGNDETRATIMAAPNPATTAATAQEPGLRILAGHKGRVWRVAFTSDGKTLATASEDRTVKLWDPQTGREVGSWEAFPRGEFGYLALAFSPNGKLLATAGGENVVRLWTVADRQPLRMLSGHGREVTAVAFSPDGTLVASASHDHSVRLWEADTGKLRHLLTGHSDRVLCVAFSPDGQTLASGAMNGEVKLWDPTTGQEIGKCGHHKRVWGLAFSRDWLASASHEPNIKLWPLPFKPQRQPTIVTDGPEVWSVAFSPDGTVLASGSHDGVVRLWNPSTGKLVGKLTKHTAPVVSVAFSENGRWLASGSWDGTALIWDRSSGNGWK